MNITKQQLTAAVAEIERLVRDGNLHYANEFGHVEDYFCGAFERHFGELTDEHSAGPLFGVMDAFDSYCDWYRELDEDARRGCYTPEDYGDYETFCISLDEKWDQEILNALVVAEKIILQQLNNP